MGNASNLRKNPTWSTILDEMERGEQICFGFPIVCARHPDQVKIISEPGQLPKVAPLGMGDSWIVSTSLIPHRWLCTSVRIQALLRTYLPIIGEVLCVPRYAILPFLYSCSVTRTLTTTRAHFVTRAVCAWCAYASTLASDSVTKHVAIVYSRSLM
jgi:hypothetical protein